VSTALLQELTSYRFIVTLDAGDAYLPPAQALLIPLFAAGGFQEVTGLGAELEVMAYPEGGVNDFVHQLPVRHSWSRIVLKRGLLVDAALWTWYQAGLTQSLGARRDGTVILMTPQGIPTVAWNFRGGLAAKWTGPAFDAMRDAVAVESLEIAHQGLDQRLMSLS
jgi:phage tail-like protein